MRVDDMENGAILWTWGHQIGAASCSYFVSQLVHAYKRAFARTRRDPDGNQNTKNRNCFTDSSYVDTQRVLLVPNTFHRYILLKRFNTELNQTSVSRQTLGWGFLYVLEPPIIPPGLQVSKPSACEIEQHDSYCPDQVQKGKTPDITFRWLRVSHRVVGKKPRADKPKPDLRHDQCQHMD